MTLNDSSSGAPDYRIEISYKMFLVIVGSSLLTPHNFFIFFFASYQHIKRFDSGKCSLQLDDKALQSSAITATGRILASFLMNLRRKWYVYLSSELELSG